MGQSLLVLFTAILRLLVSIDTKKKINKIANLLLQQIMPYRKISSDVKLAAIRLYKRELLPLDDILDCLGFHERTFYHILALWHETGDIVKHNFRAPGQPWILHFDDIDYLLRLISQRPDWFLDELLNLLRSNCFISVHYTTVHNALVQAGISLKKLKKIASERNEDACNEFIGHMAMYNPEELGFIDETSKNEKTAARSRGSSQKVWRAVMRQRFICGHRLSATALLTVNEISVTRVVEGSMTWDMYLNFLEHEVVLFFFCFFISDVPAWLGPKATALAWLEAAPALWRDGPSQSHNSWLGPGSAWPKPRLLAEKVHKGGMRPMSCGGLQNNLAARDKLYFIKIVKYAYRRREHGHPHPWALSITTTLVISTRWNNWKCVKTYQVPRESF